MKRELTSPLPPLSRDVTLDVVVRYDIIRAEGEIEEEGRARSRGDHYRRQNVGPFAATVFLLFARNCGVSAIYTVIRAHLRGSSGPG